MNQIEVFDNIIDIIQQETIKHKLLNLTSWNYVDDVSIKGNIHQRRPGFKHIFDRDNLDNSLLHLVNNTQEKIKHIKENNQILEARSFLQLPLNTDFAGTSIDTPHLDRFEPHLVFLYYVCDSDGDTVIYNYKTKKEGDIPFFEDVKELKRITPKQGRVVVFDGMYWHTAEQPKNNIRCIVNFNVK
jgi:hypothetical protein